MGNAANALAAPPRRILSPHAANPGKVRKSLLLGIDIGGSKIAYALADPSGKILARHWRPTEPSGQAEADLARIAEDARRLLGEAGAGQGDLTRVGVSVPGPLDAGAGRVIRPPNLPHWEAVPVTAILETEWGCPVALENDANAAALAEHRFGAGQGAADLVYLTMLSSVTFHNPFL